MTPRLCLFLLRCQSVHFLNFMRLLSAHFSDLLRSLQMAAQHNGVPATAPTFVSPANLLRLQSVPCLRSVMAILNRIRLSIFPWCTSPVTRLQAGFVPHTTPIWAYLLSQFSIHLTVRLQSTYQQFLYRDVMRGHDRYSLLLTTVNSAIIILSQIPKISYLSPTVKSPLHSAGEPYFPC